MKHTRQYRLLYYITWELITVCVIILTLYAISKLWYLVLIISIAATLALLNLLLLKRTKNTLMCSQIITLLIFITIVTTNYLIWGIGPLHSQWFYVMPLLAASLTGRKGLFIYSIASFVIVIACEKFSIPPYYTLPANQFFIIAWLNPIFAYLIIVTILASLIHENQRYEQELNNKNYLLEVEKDKYHYLSQFDQLTDLPNRRYFIQYLQEIIDSLAPNYCVTVFFIDLDNFKRVNDHYGHNIGDQLLLETSKRLRICFHESDFVARLGGDEFTGIVSHAPSNQTPKIIAQRVIDEFEPICLLENNIEYHYSISIGFATYPNNAQKVADLIAKADRAMYAAKKITGNSYSPTSQSSS